MLPGRDGMSILRLLRERRNAVPVLILTARAEVSERIEGLNLGADDYMTKPFSTSELVARLNALARRMGDARFSLLKVEDLTMNLITREVKRGGEKIELPPREFALLEFLMRSPGRVQSRTQICEHVWNYHFDPGTNLVDAYIQRLRRKVDDGREPKLIQTVRGVGYAMRPAE
jgi:DNA-binding response OmpR family regulator